MTLKSEIDFTQDKKYIQVLDHGFVGLIDYMGSDSAIVQAARVSYGAGTKQVQDDRNLIRYLMRHEHTTPFEMCEVKFHIKLPIFVMRQLVRHRTASMNEYSARYSVMTDEFYVPEPPQIQQQSTTNKQGREDGEWELTSKLDVINKINKSYESSYNVYQDLLDGDGNGLTRELSRSVLPVGGYTELYWKANLKNFLHMARLRMDPHAQWEIQEYARAMYNLAKPLFPEACQAFEDYAVNTMKFSASEFELLKRLITKSKWDQLVEDHRDEKYVAKLYNLSQRELTEFKKKLYL